jgi:pimeloyl-ACP methyl ester carboxylesterase
VLFGATDAESVKPQAAAMRDMVLNETQDAYAAGEKRFLSAMVKSPENLQMAVKWAVASDKSVVARAMYEVMTTDLRPQLPKIKIPVTMLYPWDATSPFPQAAVDTLYQKNFASLPDRKLVRIDNSLHFIMLDQPEKFAAELDVFLK